jgi:PIN domain nuclease of toxin-antitoxin system
VIVLDTHIWVRWLLSADPLPDPLVAQIQNEAQVGISSISCWEVTMLVARNRIELSLPIDDWLKEATLKSGVEVIPIDCKIAKLAADLPQHHRDPADRIIIATALYLGASLMSLDQQFPNYFKNHGSLIQR